MIWKAVNDKILFKVEEIKKQNIFSSDDLGNLRKGVVLSIGENVKEVLILLWIYKSALLQQHSARALHSLHFP